MWGQLPRVQNATEKMQWIQLSVTASTDNWQMPSYAQFTASLHEKYLLFSPQLDCFTAGSLFLSVSGLTLLKACGSTAEMPFQQLHCSCSQTQPWRSGHPKLHCWVQPTSLNLQEKNQKLQRTTQMRFMTNFHENAKAESSLRFWSLHFLPAPWQLPRKTENSSLKSSFLPTVHMATNPAPHGFSRLKNLLVKLAWLCYLTSI